MSATDGNQQIKILVVVAALVALALIVPHSGSFVVLLATRAMAFAILAMSVDLLLGFTGLASLGQAAYFGVDVLRQLCGERRRYPTVTATASRRGRLDGRPAEHELQDLREQEQRAEQREEHGRHRAATRR